MVPVGSGDDRINSRTWPLEDRPATQVEHGRSVPIAVAMPPESASGGALKRYRTLSVSHTAMCALDRSREQCLGNVPATARDQRPGMGQSGLTAPSGPTAKTRRSLPVAQHAKAVPSAATVGGAGSSPPPSPDDRAAADMGRTADFAGSAWPVAIQDDEPARAPARRALGHIDLSVGAKGGFGSNAVDRGRPSRLRAIHVDAEDLGRRLLGCRARMGIHAEEGVAGWPTSHDRSQQPPASWTWTPFRTMPSGPMLVIHALRDGFADETPSVGSTDTNGSSSPMTRPADRRTSGRSTGQPGNGEPSGANAKARAASPSWSPSDLGTWQMILREPSPAVSGASQGYPASIVIGHPALGRPFGPSRAMTVRPAGPPRSPTVAYRLPAGPMAIATATSSALIGNVSPDVTRTVASTTDGEASGPGLTTAAGWVGATVVGTLGWRRRR